MEDCVLDFDIDLFPQLPKYDVEKAHKSIVLIKSKVTSTHSLLKKHYNKGVICKTLENYLLNTKESYKEVCIERMEFREKCAALEEDIKKLQDDNKILQDKCVAAENQYDGIKSHSKQLALLIKENETTIESLKNDNELEKSTSKDFQKKCAALQKENDCLIRNMRSLREIVIGKKTTTKEIKSFLNKYGRPVSQEGNSSDEAEAFDEYLSPILDSEMCNQVQATPAGNKTAVKLPNANINEDNNGDDNDHDSESSNEVVSSDTGRGSSLAFSDSDKCSLLSPEYFIDHSPGSVEVIRSKDKMVVSIATSPILTREFTCVATSPIMFKNQDISKQMYYEDCDLSTTDHSKEKMNFNSCVPIMIDRVVSPIFATHYVDMSTSTDKLINCDVGTSPLKLNKKTSFCNYDTDHDHNIQEQECLNINNSSNLADENSNDGEIQMILDTMRFHQTLLTPIPTTPAKPRTEAAANIATQTTLHIGGICPDVAKVREENIALQVTVAKLAQDVMNINNFLNKSNLSFINDTGVNAEPQKMLKGKYLTEVNEGMHLQNQQLEPKTTLFQNDEVHMAAPEVTKKSLSFKGRISKLKELFDNPSPPSPDDAPLLQPPDLSFQLPATPSPTPQSPPPPSPPSPVADADVNISNHNNIESNNSFKSKERLDFEDPLSHVGSLSDEGLSDHEISYEHEIVVELSADSQESDMLSLHEILKEQQSKPDNKPLQRIRSSNRMTKLEKLRKKMAPKSKIKKAKQGGKVREKIRIQPKRLTANKERILDTDCAMVGKAAYEKARKVMAEIQSKDKVSITPVSKVVVRDRTSKTSDKNKLPSSLIEKEKRIDKLYQSIIRGGVSLKEDYSVETGIVIQRAEKDNQNEDSLKLVPRHSKTSKSGFGHKKISPSGLKRSVRTRSQSECIDGNEEYNSEMAHFNTNHLKSPSLKSYGRNRIANKSEKKTEIQHININNNTLTRGFTENENEIQTNNEIQDKPNTKTVQLENRKRLKRPSVDKPDLPTIPKRILRSSSIQHTQLEEDDSVTDSSKENKQNHTGFNKEIVVYDDLDLFENIEVTKQTKPEQVMPNNHDLASHADNLKLGILCTFLDKYSSKNIKRAPKISENIINAICKQLEDSIADIQKLPAKDTKHAMDKLVRDLQNHSLIHLLSGLIKYLKEPARKIESYNKINFPSAPPMTKVEQILIYIVAQLKVVWPDYNIVDKLLNYIEYTLFMLNRTPEFDVIENLSHFYAILCRYDKNRNRLRLFIIDAMYCLQYKAVPLIRQCLDVWMHILPLAHLGIAKNPLVTCLVYLLHFYKCEDKFNRVQDIRNILRRKYFYEISEWNEAGILEMFRNSILELRDIASEKKMLRMALIILAKRNGARWCQNHIVKDMLLPIIEQADAPDGVKHFCVALLGPLLKPYPMEMKVNCEVVMNQLFDMLKRNPTTQMEEAIFTSLIYMSRHSQHRVIKALLCWTPESVSPEFAELLKNYVKERPVKSWRQVLSKIFIQD